MGKRGAVKERLATLDEIDGIMNAMKNLALLEIHKLESFVATQRRVVTSIELAAQDFLSFHPQIQVHADNLQRIWIIVGSERSFCGDFNEQLLQFLNEKKLREQVKLLVVGRRLDNKLKNDARVTDFIEGPSVAEEVQKTLLRLSNALTRVQQQSKLARFASISAIYHDNDTNSIRLCQLLPLATPSTKPSYAYPPQLNLQPARFFSQLTDQYLYAVLHEVFYSSLMVENHMRLEHMDNAIHRLEKDESDLRLRYNRLRQEEIIEEIEIIMLSAEALSMNDKGGSGII